MNDSGQAGRDKDITKRICAFCASISGEEMYGEVLQVVLEATGSKFGIFGYLDEKGDLVVPSMTRDIWEKCRMPEKSVLFPRKWWGDSIWVRALKERRTLFSNDVSHRTPQGHIPVTRNIAAPILLGGEVIGLFQVANRETDYRDEDISMLNNIAAAIAPLLKARLAGAKQEEGKSASGELLYR